jgi:gliding motility-associated-like protein
MQFRVFVQSGVCPADTSAAATISYFNTPFPKAAYRPADTTICFGTKAQLNASIILGTSYAWIHTLPLTGTLSGIVPSVPYAVSATAAPSATGRYILSVQNAGCPNALLDTFTVRVLPKINVFAGNDTSIVEGQPLVLQATADSSVTSYLWTPATGLNDPTLLQPTATITDAMLNGFYYLTYTIAVKNAIGCSASDAIVVRIFKTGPSIFVPNAFTPNNDGINDVLRPILAGFKRLDYFMVYNRFGQLLYQTQRPGEGWDGTFKGMPQDSNTFVYMVQAVDYTGLVVQQKGSFILIR